MLFNSYTFLLFFAVVFALHSLPLRWRTKKINLLLASYIFYAAWNPPFVALLWLSTIVDWFCANAIYRSRDRHRRIALLCTSLGTNLGLLGFFKYGGFLLENFQSLAQAMGIAFYPPEWTIVLPVGISFYTFQTLSYTIDVYRGRLKPTRSALDFALYVTFFPQLVAGPIVRAADFLPQCRTPRQATESQLGWGLTLMALGLFEKVVVADSLLAPIVENIYGVPAGMSGFVSAWCGTLAFAGQIFCDFAGYSTCAIGVAMTFGFALPDNFHFPYAARGFSDFWRRWHISLSTWLRDYLYIPLGGSRKGARRTYINLALTMVLGGLWHGAAWTFVAWGALHGALLVVERGLCATRAAAWSGWRRTPGQLALTAATFTAICFTWVFFRASGFDQAFQLCAAMVGAAGDSTRAAAVEDYAVVFPMGAILLAHYVLRNTTLEDACRRLPPIVIAAVVSLLLLCILMTPGTDRAFIYFQF